jgi:mono/diheme cytochrome c family protein
VRPRPARSWAAIPLLLVVGACRQDMHDAARLDPLEASEFFSDGVASRTPPAGTVARGWLREDDHLYRGTVEGGFATTLPMPLTRALLERGRERFEIYCSPCHGRTGDGRGMIVARGFKQPQTFHQDRLRASPVGYFFDVATNGFGEMASYAAQVPTEDRWAIAAYIQALQLARHAPAAELTDEQRARLEGGVGEAEARPEGGHGGAE